MHSRNVRDPTEGPFSAERSLPDHDEMLCMSTDETSQIGVEMLPTLRPTTPRRRLRSLVAASAVAASLLAGAVVAVPASATPRDTAASHITSHTFTALSVTALSGTTPAVRLAPTAGVRTVAASLGYASYCLKTTGTGGPYNRPYTVDWWNGRQWVAWQNLQAGSNGCDLTAMWAGHYYRLRVNYWEAGKNWSGVSNYFFVSANRVTEVPTTWVY